MLIEKLMKVEIKNSELAKLLKERKKLIQEGYPHFDRIEDIVSKVIISNMKRIASDNEVWKYLRPYIDANVYKNTNDKLAKEYNELQKLEYKMIAVKDKVQKILDKEDISLKEFEEIEDVKLEKGKVYAYVADLIQRYKEVLREKRSK